MNTGLRVLLGSIKFFTGIIDVCRSPGKAESQEGVSGEVQNTSLKRPMSSLVSLDDAWLPLAQAFAEPG